MSPMMDLPDAPDGTCRFCATHPVAPGHLDMCERCADKLGQTGAPDRILWNRRNDDIDELVIHNATVHIEQMNDRCWWIGLDRGDGAHWAGNFTSDSRGRMRFTEQENDGIVWAADDSHDEPNVSK